MIIRLLVTIVILTSAGCGRSSPALPRLAPDAVILAFGNSLTFGTGAGEDESYPARLARITGRRVINAGVPGEVTGQGRVRLPHVLDEHQPALLILCHGGNDMLRKMNLDTAAENIRAMISMAGENGVHVVLLGVPKPGLFPSTAGFYEKIAEEFHIPYDGETLTDLLSDGSLKSDPIHPNARGYEALAQAIAALLKDAGALQS